MSHYEVCLGTHTLPADILLSLLLCYFQLRYLLTFSFYLLFFKKKSVSERFMKVYSVDKNCRHSPKNIYMLTAIIKTKEMSKLLKVRILTQVAIYSTASLYSDLREAINEDKI